MCLLYAYFPPNSQGFDFPNYLVEKLILRVSFDFLAGPQCLNLHTHLTSFLNKFCSWLDYLMLKRENISQVKGTTTITIKQKPFEEAQTNQQGNPNVDLS